MYYLTLSKLQFQNLKNLSEGEIAHFEASLTPVGDQTMKVEWFYNGEVLKASKLCICYTFLLNYFGLLPGILLKKTL